MDPEQTDKSIMSRLAPLTPAQRVDMQNLINAGIPPDEARAIAQGYAQKAKVAKAKETYHTAYVKAAKASLPDWQHQGLHKQARASAGGQGAKVARLRKDDAKRLHLEEIDLLKARITHLQKEVSKTSVLASEVHVPVPLGSDEKKKVPVKLAKAVDDADAMAYIKAAFDLQEPTEAPAPDEGKVPEGALPLIEANKLVAGMDQAMAAGAGDAEEARRRASRALTERPGLFDDIGANPQTAKLRGLQLDFGAGAAREPGYIGLDLGTFGDYGNAIHDLNLPLDTFPDGSAKAIRLVNSLHAILDDDGEAGDPTALLTEIQRLLCIGGQLLYEGPEPLYEADRAWPTPGLALTAEEGEDGAAVRQSFTRVEPRVPAYHGALADYAAAGAMPLDAALAMQAYNAAPADLAMANLVHKARAQVRKSLGDGGRKVPIIKADSHRQIVYGEVLAPNEIDFQDDVMDLAEIEKAAHGYLSTSRVIGSEHGAPIEAVPVESYLAPQDLTFSGPGGQTEVKKGTWILGVKILDKAEWQKVLRGDYTGFSVGGFGLREDM